MRHRFPGYLCYILDSYLHERTVEFSRPELGLLGQLLREFPRTLFWVHYYGIWHSIKSPVWSSFRTGKTICYADNMFDPCNGCEPTDGNHTSLQIREVFRMIDKLCLTIATAKTEAVLFYGRRSHSLSGLSILIGGNRIPLMESMRYLRVYLDSRLSFKDHIYNRDEVNQYFESPMSSGTQLAWLGREKETVGFIGHIIWCTGVG